MYFHVVTKITPYSLCSVIYTASIEIKLCLYVFAYKAIKTIETSEAVIQKVAAVVFRLLREVVTVRISLGKLCGVLDRVWLKRGGRRWRFECTCMSEKSVTFLS